MEKNLRYKPPAGQTISNPSREFLRDLILHPKETQWGRDTCGDAMLDFYDKDIRLYQGDVSLIFFL
jgi:hypothetical protein